MEGFGLAPQGAVKSSDIEYQAVLGKDWLSPWVEGGKFCGSRGMALPVLGLAVRLKGEAAGAYDLSYSASFVDGSTVGPVAAGKICQSESLAALEAFQVVMRPKAQGEVAVATPSPKSQARQAPAAKPGAAEPARKTARPRR